MPRFSFPSGAISEKILDPRTVVAILGKVCLISSVVLALLSGNVWRKYHQQQLPSSVVDASDDANLAKEKKPLSAYDVVLKRRLLGSKQDETTRLPTTAPISPLKLKLLGTNVSLGDEPYAIILDSSKNVEDVFGIGDSIWSQAKLVEILFNQVRVERGGKIETLVIDDEGGKQSTASITSDDSDSSDDGDETTDFEVPEEDVTNALANLPLLLSQARAVPYFKNGQSIGMRLFAIRKGSLYEKLGLKNGDIIKVVNQNNVSDPAQALKIFEQLKSERSINVLVERNNRDVQLNYSVR